MIILERKSPKTGKINSMILDTTKEALDSYYAGEGFVQDIFPNLDEMSVSSLKQVIPKKIGIAYFRQRTLNEYNSSE